ncbi:MAG: amino acid permease [Roseibacillus sp.]|jgi:APA family basic amino acid/polyamine antiporter
MAEEEGRRRRSVTLLPATAVVIGNMVGTGVFTSLGFQLAGIQSGFVLMVLWTLGGVCALCGAVCYGELAAALPRSGGEYHLLSRIYHPALGFLAGWISVTVGFAAPVALVAMAFGTYFAGISGVEGTQLPMLMSALLVFVVTAVHLLHIGVGSKFQSVFTLAKVILIVVLIAAAFLIGDSQGVSFLPKAGDWKVMVSNPFAVSLVFVMYAYTGWNAAVYIVDEVDEPRKTVPRALLTGTALVMILYLGLNAAFLYSTPIAEMKGKVEVGLVAAQSIFGEAGGKIMASLICLGLISALSAMTWAGPRVAQRMGEDFHALRFLSITSRSGIPYVAVLWQSAVVYLLLFTSSFEAVLVYVGLLLVLFALLTVIGLFWLRIRQPDLERPVKAWGYPVTPAIFIGVSLWMMVYVARANPAGALWGLATVAVGGGVYLFAIYLSPKRACRS